MSRIGSRLTSAISRRRWILIGAVLLSSACDGKTALSPSPPLPVPGPVAPPPSVPQNTAPRINVIYMSSNRVEADERLELAADVVDEETPIDQLFYQWTSDKGTGMFIGSGRILEWQAPHLKPTPDIYVLTLTVVERYEDGGEVAENRTSASVKVHYNDSNREIWDLGLTFLNDFTTYTTSPEACVRNFSDSCRGKQAELSDIRENRKNFQILSGKYALNDIALNGNKTFGTSHVSCEFRSLVKATGKTETATGICTLTAVYEPETWQWYLCDSLFSGTATSNLNLRGLVP